jgi:hypothetical protein
VALHNDEAFPTLSDADIALLQGHGIRRAVQAGEYLFRQGDQTREFYVVLSGSVDILVHSEGADHVIVRHEAGRFAASSISSLACAAFSLDPPERAGVNSSAENATTPPEGSIASFPRTRRTNLS